MRQTGLVGSSMVHQLVVQASMAASRSVAALGLYATTTIIESSWRRFCCKGLWKALSVECRWCSKTPSCRRGRLSCTWPSRRRSQRMKRIAAKKIIQEKSQEKTRRRMLTARYLCSRRLFAVQVQHASLQYLFRALIRIHATLGDLPFFNDS